jgi:hypothetical protein
MDEKWFLALSKLASDLSLKETDCNLRNWGLAFRQGIRAHVARESKPSSLLLCRSGIWVQDLRSLVLSLSELFGSRIVRLGVKTWTEFPESLGPALARQLAGAALVVLQGPEDMRRFSEVALVDWLLSDSEEWQGADGCTYRLALPRCFLLTGRPLPKLPYVDSEVGDRLICVGGER